MSLYPTLEDMKVHQLQQAQYAPNPSSVSNNQSYPSLSSNTQSYNYPPPPYTQEPASSAMAVSNSGLYPSVDDYMGLSLVSCRANAGQLATASPRAVVAPVSSANWSGIKRAAIKPGVTEVTLCKDNKGNVGLRAREVTQGIFVQLVIKDSPAALGGLRFGDQILSINDEVVAGYSADKVHKIIKSCDPKCIRIAIRERPFERTITLTRDSVGITGFVFKNGKIVSIVKDSSAARNGLLTDHQLVEINGENVIGLKDSEIERLMNEGGDRAITITIMPTSVYDHMIKSLGSLIKKMDHGTIDC